MKKYKLIREYPGSPKLGTVLQKEFTSNIYKDINYNSPQQTCNIVLHESAIENYPEFWKKLEEEPILITEDKVEIHKGDTVYFLNIIEGTIFNKEWSVHKFSNITTPNLIHQSIGKYFSTKENAQKYALENKPKYSKNEVINILQKFDETIQHFSRPKQEYEKYLI